jgi:spectinomycin phosphotransferase
VRSRFDAVPEDEVRELLRTAWGVAAVEWEAVLEGAGAHHWSARGTDGRRWFVTCDDLATKPWLGVGHDAVFDRLRAAYDAAIGLQRGGLTAVVAPIPSRSQRSAERLDDRHSLAVFEHVDGRPGRWGDPVSAEETHQIVEVLAALHRSAVSGPEPAVRGLDVPGRAALLAVLDELDHRGVVAAWIAELDRIAAGMATRPHARVITHGEPHPGNLIWTVAGPRLVDWDTVAVGPPERDLWMLTAIDPTAAGRYRDLTGTTLDEDLLAAFHLLWAVTDVAAYAAQLSLPHRGSADDEQAREILAEILDGALPEPYGPAAARPLSP